MRFILRLRKELRRATNANKIIINKREAKDDTREARKARIETRRTKVNTKASARASVEATTTIAITTTITINKKQLLRLRKRFVCTHVNFVLETISILLNCLLLFTNSREYASNTLYN